MKTTRLWVIVLALVLLGATGAAIALSRVTTGQVATVTLEGQVLYRIDLSRVTAPYTITVTGVTENVIAVDKGRICVQSATCPDQICVHQGWLEEGIAPIVCLPNGLVIALETTGGHVDVMTS